MRLKWVLLTFLFVFSAAITTTYAQAESAISQEIRLNENNTATVRYELNITNTSSEELISRVTFQVPFSDAKVLKVQGADGFTQDQQTITLSLFKNPINIRKSRLIVIDLQVNKPVNEYGGFKRLSLSRFTGEVKLTNYRVQIFYPGVWGNNLYTSRIGSSRGAGVISYNENEQQEIVWSSPTILNSFITEEVNFERENILLPIIGNMPGQTVYLKNYANVRGVYADEANNLFVNPSSPGKMEVNSNLVLGNNDISYPSVDSLNEYSEVKLDIGSEYLILPSQKVSRVASTLRDSFKPSDRKDYETSFEELSGDELNLAIIAASALRENGVPAYIVGGWDLGVGGDRGYSYWVYWKGIDQWEAIDFSKYINGQSDNYQAVNPERVILFSMIDLTKKEFDKIDKVTKKPYTPIFTPVNQSDKSDKQPSFTILWDNKNSSTKHMKAKVNIDNPTANFLILEELKVNNETLKISPISGYKIVVLPFSFKIIDIDYFDDSLSFEPSKILTTMVSFNTNGTIISVSDQSTLAHLKLVDKNLGVVLAVSFITIFGFPIRLIGYLAKRINSYTIRAWKSLPKHKPTTTSTI